MTDDILKNRKNVKEFDTTAVIPQELIEQLLRRAWKVTPSKNNFMPYTIHVLGPDQQEYKNCLYNICLGNEGKADGVDTAVRYQQSNSRPQYSNILTCSYALIFAMRHEYEPNPYQLDAISRGYFFEAMDYDHPNRLHSVASLEAGLFADAFSAMCLENNIDVSYTLCFKHKMTEWQTLPFVKEEPVLILTVGKGKIYSYDIAVKKGTADLNRRPDFERIVNFVKST